MKVRIEKYRDNIRLRWTEPDTNKRRCLALGVQHNKVNLVAATAIASRIEVDVLTGCYDPTLARYHTRYQQKVEPTQPEALQVVPTCSGLFRQWRTRRLIGASPKTAVDYQQAQDYIDETIGTLPSDSVTSVAVDALVAHIRGLALNDSSKRKRLSLIRSCWAEMSPSTTAFSRCLERIKGSTSPPPRPFTQAEAAAILNAFQGTHYQDYVTFLLTTGVRTGEAIGLRWGAVNLDASVVCIRESLTDGVRQGTKTGEVRYVRCSAETQEMLQRLRFQHTQQHRKEPDDEALVFLSPEGSSISANNFRRRAWKPVLEMLDISYRKPYSTRSTFISHALQSGMSPLDVAQITGHDVAVLYKHYAGSVSSTPIAPSLYTSHSSSQDGQEGASNSLNVGT